MTTLAPRTKILLIGNNQPVADSIVAVLAATTDGSFDVQCVRQLSEGLDRLNEKGIDAILLDLALPDSQGIESFDKLFTAAPDVPILILGGNVPEGIAKLAVGAVNKIISCLIISSIPCHGPCATQSYAAPSKMPGTWKKSAR